MLQHLETGDHLEGTLLLSCHCLGGALPIVDLNTALQLMESRHG